MSIWSKLFGKAREPGELEALIEELSTAMRPWVRAATRLVPEPWDDPGCGIGSRTGGAPYAEPGEPWPMCGTCATPLDFVAQIDLRECASRPTEAFDLLTLFYCWECFPWGDLSAEEAGQWTVRTYCQPAVERCRVTHPPTMTGQRSRPCRLEPLPVRVLPSGEELDLRDRALAERLEALPEYPDIVEAIEARLVGEPLAEGAASLVGGYPLWIQSEQAPTNTAGRRFELLAQLDSEPAPGWMWGDAGIVYLLFDPDDPSYIRLILQCH